MSSKDFKPTQPSMKTRHSSTSLTIPVSPFLICKTRSRSTCCIHMKEREERELSRIRKNPPTKPKLPPKSGAIKAFVTFQCNAPSDEKNKIGHKLPVIAASSTGIKKSHQSSTTSLADSKKNSISKLKSSFALESAKSHSMKFIAAPSISTTIGKSNRDSTHKHVELENLRESTTTSAVHVDVMEYVQKKSASLSAPFTRTEKSFLGSTQSLVELEHSRKSPSDEPSLDNDMTNVPDELQTLSAQFIKMTTPRRTSTDILLSELKTHRESLKKKPVTTEDVKNVETKLMALPGLSPCFISSYQCFTRSLPEPSDSRNTTLKVPVSELVPDCNSRVTLRSIEISNFGAPNVIASKTKSIKMAPFSFDARNKEFQMRKEQKIKDLIAEEEKKLRIQFHARPVPTSKKTMIPGPKEPAGLKARTKQCPFSFEERDKKLMKKKEELAKGIPKEERRNTKCHANAINGMRSALVKETAKGIANSKGRIVRRPSLPVAEAGCKNVSKKVVCTELNVISDKENRNPNGDSDKGHEKLARVGAEPELRKVTNVLREFHLNTDKRARMERKQFDIRMERKKNEMELLRKKMEGRRVQTEKTGISNIASMVTTSPALQEKTSTMAASDKPSTKPQPQIEQPNQETKFLHF